MESELEQTLRLAEEATFPGLKAALASYAASIPPSVAPPAAVEAAVASSDTEAVTKAVSAATTVSAQPKAVYKAPVAHSSEKKYVPIDDFAWDQGDYNSDTITVYVELESVGTVKDNVSCNFTKGGFDLTVQGLNAINYRLVKDNLEKDIVPDESRIIVKRNKVVIKLRKVKGEYSYEHWTNLTSKKSREEVAAKKKDPMGGIMDMMKDMYNDGDDNMKKIIGEAMLKSQRGEAPEMPK